MMRRQIVFVTPLDADSALMLRINGKHLALPIAPSIVVGRLPYATDVLDRRPHVDLSAFDAQHKGVSLEHQGKRIKKEENGSRREGCHVRRQQFRAIFWGYTRPARGRAV